MGLSTYTSLVHTVKEVIEDDSAEISALIPTAIFLAQERIDKDTDSKMFTAFSSAASSAIENVSVATSGIETHVSTGIPSSGFLYFRNVYYNGRKLDLVDTSYTKEINRMEASAGANPRYYSYDDTPAQITVAPPVSAGKFTFSYGRKTSKISNSNQTNVITQRYPELLYYATMVEISRVMKNWDTVNQWEGPYTSLLASNLNTTRKERTDIGQKHTNISETQSTAGGQ